MTAGDCGKHTFISVDASGRVSGSGNLTFDPTVMAINNLHREIADLAADVRTILHRLNDDTKNLKDENARLTGERDGLMRYIDDVKLEAQKLGRVAREPLAQFLKRFVIRNEAYDELRGTIEDVKALARRELARFGKHSGSCIYTKCIHQTFDRKHNPLGCPDYPHDHEDGCTCGFIAALNRLGIGKSGTIWPRSTIMRLKDAIQSGAIMMHKEVNDGLDWEDSW